VGICSRQVLKYSIGSASVSLCNPGASRSAPNFLTPQSHFHPSPMSSNNILKSCELRAHLDLLRAFHDLKRQVVDDGGSEADISTLGGVGRWESFVRGSVERCVLLG
jgi:hypothetical protein